MKVKINKPLKKYAVGQIVEINPSEQYWAKRLQDAEIDNCIEIVKENEVKEFKPKSEVKKYGKSASK
jgi:hypothetical protein